MPSTVPTATGSAVPNKLNHQWILAGIASAAARFVPLPLVDDFIRNRTRQFVVARTLSHHDYDYSSGQLAPLYDQDGGFVRGMIRKITRIPLRIALFPIRKLVRIFGSVRGVPLDLMRTYLIGRTLDRCIRDGLFAPEDPVETRKQQSLKVRQAFDEAFDNIDWRAVKGLMSDAMNQVGHWKTASTDLANEIFGRDSEDPERVKVDAMDHEPEVQRGAEEVERLLETPKIKSLVADFDQRFDRAFSAEQQTA